MALILRLLFFPCSNNGLSFGWNNPLNYLRYAPLLRFPNPLYSVLASKKYPLRLSSYVQTTYKYAKNSESGLTEFKD